MYAYITHITTTTIKIKDFSKLKVPLSPLLLNAIPLMHLHHLQNPLHGSKQALIWFLSLQTSLYQNSFKWNHTVWTKVCLTSVLLCFSFSAWFWNLFILLHVSLVHFFLLMSSIPLYVYVVVLFVHAQSCPTLCDLLDWSPKASFVHGILQARILEWVAISYSRGSSQPRDQTLSPVSPALAGRFTPHHLGRPCIYIYTTICLWVYPLTHICWLTFELLGIRLLWTFVYKSLYDHVLVSRT